MSGLTALIAGSTGLVGRNVAHQLAASSDYDRVFALVRAGALPLPDGVDAVETDFEALMSGRDLPKADHVYICLGTTIKKAGSQENFSRIDRDYVAAIAAKAHAAGARRLAVVSSVGVTPSTGNFYLSVKAQMEAAVTALPFERISIVRPSLLVGERPGDKRLMEGIFQTLAPLFDPLLRGSAARYHSVKGETVAAAMIAATLNGELGTDILEYDAIKSWATRLA